MMENGKIRKGVEKKGGSGKGRKEGVKRSRQEKRDIDGKQGNCYRRKTRNGRGEKRRKLREKKKEYRNQRKN